MVMLKTCSRCKVEKSLDLFNKCSSDRDGLAYYCKACQVAYAKAYDEQHKEARIARDSTYYVKHREVISAKKVAYYAENIVDIKQKRKEWRYATQYSKKYYASHKEKARVSHKKWAEKNSDYLYKYRQEYIKTNPDKYTSKRGSRFFCSFVIKPHILERDSYCCQLCNIKKSGRLLQLHHIVPINKDSSDLSILSPLNLVTLCKSCHMLVHAGNYKTIDLGLADKLSRLVTDKEHLCKTILPFYEAFYGC